jgi:hypothetical protein
MSWFRSKFIDQWVRRKLVQVASLFFKRKMMPTGTMQRR